MAIQGFSRGIPKTWVFYHSENFKLGMRDIDEGFRFREKWELPEDASVRYERGRQFALVIGEKRKRTFKRYEDLRREGVIL